MSVLDWNKYGIERLQIQASKSTLADIMEFNTTMPQLVFLGLLKSQKTLVWHPISQYKEQLQ